MIHCPRPHRVHAFFPRFLFRRLAAGFIVWMAASMASGANAEDASILGVIPIPVEARLRDGRFTLTPSTRIVAANPANPARQVAHYLAERLNRPTGYRLEVSAGESENPAEPLIQFNLNEEPDATIGREGYRLSVEPHRVRITANEPAGLFYGAQTLLELTPPEAESPRKIEGVAWAIPCVEITDYPRFAWRGLLLDVSRHFFTKEEVEQYIDRMARYKFNTLHMHLTDDQGWRIEIRKYPKLTEVGAWRVPREGQWWGFDPPGADEKPTYGGFYTQDDIREIVAHAQARFITIVPEIEGPGHAMAALAAYPELSCGGGPFQVNPGSKFYGEIENTLCPAKEEVYTFLDGVFEEVAQLFPGEYIHMGGDEAFKGFWAKSPECQRLKQEQGLKDENELQSYFVKRVEKIIESKGKRLIGWDEILEGGLAPNATVMSWRGTRGGIAAANMGHDVVMSPAPYYYLDLYQGDPVAEPDTYSMSRLSVCYGFEPVPDGVDPELILGVQGNLWSEEVSEFRHAQYMTWPRGLAIAETAWSPKEKKNWPDFAGRVERQFARLDATDIKYARSMFDVIFKPRRDDEGRLVIELATEIDGLDIHYTFEGANPDRHYPKYDQPLTVPRNAVELRVITYRGDQPIGRQINMPIAELEKRAGK